MKRIPSPGNAPFTAAALLAALALALSPAALAAEEAAPTPRLLTLEEALTIAADNNKDIKKALEEKNSLRGRYVEERSAAFPHLTASSFASRSVDEAAEELGNPDTTDAYGVNLGLDQALFTWGRIPSAIRVAKLGLDLWQDDLGRARQTAVRDVTGAFYDVLLAREVVRITAENLQQKERHLDEARKRLAAGTATDYDVLAAEVDAKNARTPVISAENAVRVTRDRLRYAMGVEKMEVDAGGSLEAAIAPIPGYEEALGSALARRPELLGLRRRIAMSDELVNVYAAGNKPRLDLKADAGWGRTDPGNLSGEGANWSAALVLTFPFFDGGKTGGKVAQAKSDAASLRLDEQKLSDAIALDLRVSLAAVREARETIDALAGAVQQAEKLLEMAEKGFTYGVKTRLEVDDAALNLSQARVNLARARRDEAVAQVNLRWVMGAL